MSARIGVPPWPFRFVFAVAAPSVRLSIVSIRRTIVRRSRMSRVVAQMARNLSRGATFPPTPPLPFPSPRPLMILDKMSLMLFLAHLFPRNMYLCSRNARERVLSCDLLFYLFHVQFIILPLCSLSLFLSIGYASTITSRNADNRRR